MSTGNPPSAAPFSSPFGSSTARPPSAAPFGSLFGSSTAQPPSAAPSGSLFGSSTAQPPSAAPSGSLFGSSTVQPSSATPSGSVFGSSTAAPPASAFASPPSSSGHPPTSRAVGTGLFTTSTTPTPAAAPNPAPTPIPVVQSPPYTPSKHLSTGPFLTPQQLVSEYEEFTKSLKSVFTAPELVFERLVASLKISFNAAVAVEVERQREEWKKEEEEKKKKEEEEREEGEEGEEEKKNAPGIIEGSAAIGTVSTVVKSDDSSIKPKNPLVGYQSRALTGDITDFGVGYGKLFLFDGFKIPLEHRDSTTYDICLPIAFTKLNFNSPVRRPSFTTADNYINIPTQTSRSASLQVAFNWLEISSSEPDFQYGRVDTGCHNCYIRSELRSIKEARVRFARPYATIPAVAVWFSDFTIKKSSTERFEAKVYATNITKTGFTISLLEPGAERFLVPIITWFAYSATREDVFKGNFSTAARRPWDEKPLESDGNQEIFLNHKFASPPRVFIGFDSLDVDAPKGSMEVETVIEEVTEEGMLWHISAPKPTELNSASVTYLAFA